jgi:hypothetical protein
MASKKNGQMAVLLLVIAVLGGVVYWQQGTRDCEKRLNPLETRFLPGKGCEVKVGEVWHNENEMKDSIKQGVKQIEEGSKKVMEGIFGNEPEKK